MFKVTDTKPQRTKQHDEHCTKLKHTWKVRNPQGVNSEAVDGSNSGRLSQRH